MLCSHIEEERREAIKKKKVKLRGAKNDPLQFGDMSFRIQKTNNIIIEATCLSKHIDWSDIAEPPLTCHLSTEAIKVSTFLCYP